MLRALGEILRSAHRARKPVSVCGEIAGDPVTALVLLGMGFDGLSMSPAALLKVKWAVRNVNVATMHAVAAEALRCESADAIDRVLDTMRRDMGLDRIATQSFASATQAVGRQHALCPAT